jgi:TrmH family RNA methyltransferase
MMPPDPGAIRHITSLQNERVKFIRSLEMRKARRESGLFVAEGASLIISGRERGWVPEILVSLAGSGDEEGRALHRGVLAWAQEAGTEVLEVSQAVLAKLAAKDNPQTMLGVYRQRWSKLPEATDSKAGDVWLALEEVRDPGNLGTIIRTVDAVGGRGVILVGNTCDPYSREAIRATMGSVFAVPIVKVSKDAFLEWRRSWSGDVVGTYLDAKDDFRQVRLKEPLLVVMGSEGPGMSEEMRRACSRLVVIPMAGPIDSLNLAVATALALYQFRSAHLKL